MKNLSIIVVIILCTLGAPSMAADLSTPENALKSLEDAYRHKDLEGAVAAKDFLFEAAEMVRALKNIPAPDEKLIQETAQVLELAFRKQMKTDGFPDFNLLRCTVVKKSQLKTNLVEMVEECIFPDGGKSTDTLHAFKSEHGWRIVILTK